MTEAGVLIRRLAAEDLVAYKALRDAMLTAYPEAFTSDAAAEASREPSAYLPRLGLDRLDGGQFTLGAWLGDTLIGALGCERDMRVKVRHIAHVIGMMVRPDCAGRGTGGQLLQACIAALRQAEGVEMLTLSVTQENHGAVGLYARAGFIRHGSLPRAIRVDGRYHAKDQMHLML